MIRDLWRADRSPGYPLLSSAVLSQFKDGLKDAKGNEAHAQAVDHSCGPPASEKTLFLLPLEAFANLCLAEWSRGGTRFLLSAGG